MSGLFGGGKSSSVNTTQNQLSALSIQTSTQGIPIPIIYGSTRVSGNLIWYGNFTPVPHTSSTSSGGGKGGSITTTNTNWTYTCGIAMGVCEGPINSFGRVWSNKDLSDDLNLGFSEFLGTYAQAPWSYLTTNFPLAALNNKGLAYVANSVFDLGNSNYLPNLSYEINGLLYTGAGPTVTNATLDPGQKNPHIVLSNGNLTATLSTPGIGCVVKSNVYKSAGLLYCEMTVQNPVVFDSLYFGLVNTAAGIGDNQFIGCDTNGFAYIGTNWVNWSSASNVYNNNWNVNNGGGFFTNGCVVGMLYDANGRTVTWTINGVATGVTMTLPAVGSFTPAITLHYASGASITVTMNYGASAFAFAPGGGYGGWSGSSTQFDVTPAAVAYDLIPNVPYGAGFPAGRLPSPTDFDAYCVAAGFTCSPAYTTQVAAKDIVTELCQIGNASPVWSEGVLKLIPYCDAVIGSYTPNTTINYNLTDDDYITPAGEDPIKITRKRQADAYNQVSIECLDRNNSYNIATITVQDQASIDLYGLRPLAPIVLHAVCLPSVAILIAQAVLKRVLYFRNIYEFTVGWSYARLEPMDLISLTDAGLGLATTPVRTLSIDEDDNGNLKMTAEDFFAGVSNPSTTYSVQTGGSAYVPNTASPPGNAGTPVIIQPPVAMTGTSQIWVGASSLLTPSLVSPDWGGAEVWISSDNVTFNKYGSITAPATIGVLTANLPTHVDPDAVSTLSVNLSASRGAVLTVPQAQADALITLCYVDGELIAYETATPTSANHYDLTYLRRGAYGSTIGLHLTGTTFMRLDSAPFRMDCPASWPGTTIYVKLLSFNSAGAGLQALSDVTSTSYAVVSPAPISIDGGTP